MPRKSVIEKGIIYKHVRAIKPTEARASDGRIVWKCKCNCGKICYLPSTAVKSTSCGCARKSREGRSESRLYVRYYNMIARTSNPHDKSYESYGARGIKFYKKWAKDYDAFRNYVINLPNCPPLSILDKPSKGKHYRITLDRIDNEKSYAPGNLRWTDYKTQAANTRATRRIHYKKKDYSLSEFCRVFNLPYQRMVKRLNSGLSIKEAMSRPSQQGVKGCLRV